MYRFLVCLVTALLVSLALGQDGPTTAEVAEAGNLDNVLGTVTFAEGDEGVVATFDIQANEVISPGEHGIHIHENGDCSAEDTDGDGTEEPAGAAGGHFNPTDVGHGEDNGPHVGDSQGYNYAFGDDGTLRGDVGFPLASLEGENGILGDGGTAIVIHEGTDDRTTDPSGESGPRIACGVIGGEAQAP